MKQLKQLLGALLFLSLGAVSMGVLAETQLGGRDFNHMSTGFPLAGGHATTACETCHVGGVFKGTPRNCDGCHALGKRVVATPKSTSHLVTDAPCESCHFNTSTFLGARYNHATAQPGKCTTCHNGRIAMGKHAKHIPTVIAGDRCDQCHRSTTWIPASWNHNGVAQDCLTCHKLGGPGRAPQNAAGHALYATMGINGCSTCHKNYYNFMNWGFDHVGTSPQCQTCHVNAAYAAGVVQMTSTANHTFYSATMGITNCQSCHKSFTTFLGARYDHVGASPACDTCHNAANSPPLRKMSAAHVPYPAGLGCNACHVSTGSWMSVITGAALHGLLLQTTPLCTTCHYPGTSPYATMSGRMRREGPHEGYAGPPVQCNNCHAGFTRWH